MTTAIAWLTHHYDDEEQAAFHRLASEAFAFGDVYQFRDGVTLRKGESPTQIISLSEEEVIKASPRRHALWAHKMQSGPETDDLMDILMMAIAQRLRDYDYFWFIESDVDFTGDWATFFSDFTDCTADLLCMHICQRHMSSDWYHWPTFGAPFQLQQENQIKGFFPVSRFSRAFTDLVSSEINNGWSGHFEAILPTMANCWGLSIEDIGDTGPWTPASRKGMWCGSTYRYRPPVASHYHPYSDVDLPRNNLIHPVKTAASHNATGKRRRKKRPKNLTSRLKSWALNPFKSVVKRRN